MSQLRVLQSRLHLPSEKTGLLKQFLTLVKAIQLASADGESVPHFPDLPAVLRLVCLGCPLLASF